VAGQRHAPDAFATGSNSIFINVKFVMSVLKTRFARIMENQSQATTVSEIILHVVTNAVNVRHEQRHLELRNIIRFIPENVIKVS
jgi:hypothetical protein